MQSCRRTRLATLFYSFTAPPNSMSIFNFDQGHTHTHFSAFLKRKKDQYTVTNHGVWLPETTVA